LMAQPADSAPKSIAKPFQHFTEIQAVVLTVVFS